MEVVNDIATDDQQGDVAEIETVDTPSEANESVDDMSNDELTATDEPEAVNEEATEPTLDDLYKTQMEEPDAKLDKPIFLKYNGSVHRVDTVKELKNLSEQGISFTAKQQDMSEQRKLLERLEANGYDSEALMSLAESHKGEQLTEVDYTQQEVDSVATEIMGSSYKDEFTQLAAKLPKDVAMDMQRNPNMLKGFAQDVESGFAGHIMQDTVRNMQINGMDFKQAYTVAGKTYMDKTQATDDKRQTLSSQPTKSIETPVTTEVDPWKLSKAEFDKFMNK